MNHDGIASYLQDKGYDSTLYEDDNNLRIICDIAGRKVRLLHRFPSVILRLPAFSLADAPDFGVLAHVLVRPGNTVGSICLHQADSISVNSEVPELAYHESIKRHIGLLERLITDSAWNHAELLREFHSNWFALCSHAKTPVDQLYCAADVSGPHGLQIKRPDTAQTYGFRQFYTGLDAQQSTNKAFKTVRDRLNWESRPTVGKSCFLVLDKLIPAPIAPEELPSWYEKALKYLDTDSQVEIARFSQSTGKEYWLVFVSETETGKTWFAIRFRSKSKRKLPTSATACVDWDMDPIHVRAMTRDALMPRSGASLALGEKSVLLVGCGSVGSELAHRLGSSGVGHMRLQDPQVFDIDNLYRHTLALHDVGYYKCLATSMDLELGYPWIQVDISDAHLEDLATKDGLNDYDLIVVAIGSPTIERYFHKKVRKAGISTPVINTWVEAFGIGGHATLEIPGSPGCLSCAYVDPNTSQPGLASNLNFLEPNQDVTITHAGCGTQFLPYSGIAASYTATMAADLATRYLQGSVDTPSRISWKGSDNAATDQGFTLSHRFHQFRDSLLLQSLHNPECLFCD